MNREQIQSFIKECGCYMTEQLQKEVVYYLRDNDVLTEAEFKDITAVPQREHQIVLLLDLLPSKQLHQLNLFIQYVSDWYVWIIHNFRRKSQIEDYAEQEKEKMLDLGEVPPLPSRYVQRREQYAILCKYLHELKRNEYIVVHGMRGCGKSTLVVDVLRHSYTLALETFKQKVFWLTVGRESCIDELTIQQELCSKIMFNRGYGLQIPLDSKSAKQFLKEKLTNADLEDCLLILDDVSSATIIQALDVGCRILVTTDDTAIMNRTNKKVHFMKVSEGFTEDETLSLFSKCIDSDNLPHQAKIIYSICKGFPLTISLVSSQLEEHKKDVQHNESRWNVYVSKLSQKNMEGAFGRYDFAKQERVTSLYKAIGMSIDSLRPDLKDLYQDFALFMDDVNIKVEVLSTLWELEETDVHDIMRDFERKCLVIRAWNHARECYIYCVHDLLLDYLKKQISSTAKEELHRKLIKKYQKRFGQDVTNFPISDNYIFLYLGHHLMEANLLDYFPRVFLDLQFIDKKITNFGAADLLLDFRKYQKFIARDARSTKHYEEVLHFIKHIGARKTFSNSDIIQFGLCEHKDSYVYQKASAMAKGGKYFEILTDIPKEKSAPTVHYGLEEIVTAAFASDENVLVANSTGTIKLVNIPQQRTLISFREHEKRVTLLQLTKNLVYFLSASDDCTIRIWYLNDYSSLEKNLSEKARTPSPQLRQINWVDAFPTQRHSGERSVATLNTHQLPIKHAQWSNTGTLVVSTGEDLKTIVWRLTLERKDLKRKDLNYTLSLIGHDVIETKKKFESVAFSNDDTMILCAMREGQVFLYQSDSGSQVTVVDVGREIESMNVIPGFSHIVFFVMHKDFFHVWEVLPTAGSGDDFNTRLRYRTAERKREDPYVCSAISWDGTYAAMATKNQCIIIFELATNSKISKFTESSGKICSLSWSRQNTALLTTYGSELLKIWHFSKTGVLNCSAKLCPCSFDAQWLWDLDDDESCNDRPFVTAALDNDKKIHVFYDLQEKETLSTSSKAEILQCCVSPFDGNIFYACGEGSVYLVVLDSWETHQIMKVPCHKLLKLKVFALANRILVLVLAEIAPGRKSLIGCKKRKDNDFVFDMMTYVADSDHVFDFSADLKTDSIYVVDNNHILKTYSYQTAAEKFKEGAEAFAGLGHVEFCDISADFSYIITGNKELGFVRSIPDGAKRLMVFENEVKVFRFNADGTMLAVGFCGGRFNIYETKGNSKLHSVDPLKFAAEIKDFVWCADNSRLLVIFNREIILYNIWEQVTAESMLCVSVEKVVCNDSFTKCVTIDSECQFKVLKFPRN